MQTNGRPAFFNWTNRSARHHQETILLHLVVDLFAAGEIRSSAERCKRYRNVHDSPALVNRGALKRNSFPRLCCSRGEPCSVWVEIDQAYLLKNIQTFWFRSSSAFYLYEHYGVVIMFYFYPGIYFAGYVRALPRDWSIHHREDSTISSPETNQYKPTCLDPGRKLKPRCWARDSCQASP
ncbi:Hypp4817 [Branchiostoma lanceolatum]|uniref:Hypp4817 protein n=1 Tax=Branchiostoma lanceolatum TaxID=7740 RepID=A0A8K0AGK4_BRALA|nr:Hypp4817 [Branchiostoma lanceolatum]